MTLPTFLFIGPDKTGSSWLYEMLRQHPSCYVPGLKDLYFFDRHYERGLSWYASQFAGAPPEARVVGELSHDYLFSPLAAERIHRDLPGVKLMTTLRDPVDRTFSHYLYMIRSGRTRMPFEAALAEYPELMANSLYAKHLEPYMDLFDEDSLRVFWFQDLRRDSERFLSQVLEFLGLDLPDGLELQGKVLPASRPRSYVLARLVKWGADQARGLGLTGVLGRVKRSAVVKGLLYQPYGPEDRPQLDPETRERLVIRFQPSVERLESLLGVELRDWKRS